MRENILERERIALSRREREEMYLITRGVMWITGRALLDAHSEQSSDAHAAERGERSEERGAPSTSMPARERETEKAWGARELST